MMLTLQEKVGWFAFYSRLLIIILSAFFNIIIPDHDAGVFLSPANPQDSQTFADHIVSFVLGGLVRWDAHYFLHISSYGYTYENCLAFFPLYPMSVRVVTNIIHYPLRGLLTQNSVAVISAVSINVACFVCSARTLYDLSLRVLKSKDLSYKAALLFCINPASIFFSAPYSETMFSYLTFYGMFMMEESRLFDSGVLFGLAGATRSNGILNVGFLVYYQFQAIVRLSLPKYLSKKHSSMHKFTSSFLILTRGLIFLSLSLFISLVPFVAFQVYGFYKFCFASDIELPEFIVFHAKSNKFILPGANSFQNISGHWCSNTLPLAYSYIQSHYWNVGLLKYYEWKQIPNFILAFPVVFLVISQSVKFCMQHRQHCITHGLFADDTRLHGHPALNDTAKEVKGEVKFSRAMFVYIAHAASLVVFCLLCIHVQVTTRLLASASPVLYWFAAYFFFPSGTNCQSENSALSIRIRKIFGVKYSKEFDSRIEPVEHLYSRWKVNILTQLPPSNNAKLIIYYFLLYYLLGTILFSNFLPWT